MSTMSYSPDFNTIFYCRQYLLDSLLRPLMARKKREEIHGEESGRPRRAGYESKAGKGDMLAEAWHRYIA